MTSIVDGTGEPRPLTWARSVLLLLFLSFGALGTPWPWATLWLAVPLVVATAVLLAWRFGRAAWFVPAVLLLGALGGSFLAERDSAPLWFTLWLPAAALVGVWMGLREEGGGPALGARAWMFVPLLIVAAGLPLLSGFDRAIARMDETMLLEQERVVTTVPPGEMPESLRAALKQAASLPGEERRRTLTMLVPNLMFLWMVLLVASGRALAARFAAVLGWPRLSRAPLVGWRLPDAALVPLIAGIALLVFADRTWHPSALTLLVHVVLGYSVQGVAVVESLLLSRGMSPTFVALTMLFVIAASLLWVMPAIAVVGLSDVWLDYRRLEPSRGEA